MTTRFDCSDPLYYADIREALHLGAQTLYDAEDGILLKRNGKLFAAGEAATALPEFLGCSLVLMRGGQAAARLMSEGCFTECMEVAQFVYTKPDIGAPACGADIRRLEMSDMGFMLENYHHPNSRRDYLEGRINELMLGAFINDVQVGCIGVHAEGAMGMLEVKEEYRRRGIARALQAELIRRLLERGSIPYCHVEPDNKASLRLQRSLGLTECQRHVFWLYKPV